MSPARIHTFALTVLLSGVVLTSGCQQVPQIDHEELVSAGIVDLDATIFEQRVINSEKPVLVDCWATWCGPCRAMDPILVELAEEYSDRIMIGKVDVDANPQLAQALQIEGMPTFVFFQNGKEVNRIMGQSPKGVLSEVLDGMLAVSDSRP